MKNKIHNPSRRATPWDKKDNPLPIETFIRSNYLEYFNHHHEKIIDVNEAELLNNYVPKCCPRCLSPNFKKNGLYASNLQKYYCNDCKKNFNILTGTIFEDHKIPISGWIEYILETISYESNRAISLNNRNSESTTPYWLHKLFLLLEDYQDDIMLKTKIWIDETYYSVIHKDLVLIEGKKLRGISRNKYIIGVGVDVHGNTYVKLEGIGKPSISSTSKTFINHIEQGSILEHDKEHSHSILVKKLNLISHSYNSKELAKLDDENNPLKKVNDMCFLLKSFLNSHSGFNRDDLQNYLNLFSFIVNSPRNKLEKVKILLDKAICNPKTLHYRDFYSKKDDE